MTEMPFAIEMLAFVQADVADVCEHRVTCTAQGAHSQRAAAMKQEQAAGSQARAQQMGQAQPPSQTQPLSQAQPPSHAQQARCGGGQPQRGSPGMHRRVSEQEKLRRAERMAEQLRQQANQAYTKPNYTEAGKLYTQVGCCLVGCQGL